MKRTFSLVAAGAMCALALFGSTLVFGQATGPLSAPASDNEQNTPISQIVIKGNERIEADTVKSYMTVEAGQPYDVAEVDKSLKTLFATGLFADVSIRRENANLVVKVVENPIINRVFFLNNKAVKDDDLRKEAQLQPRSVYTRAKVEADVQRIVEIYRRSGRFAVKVNPQVVQLPQNRVDLIYEINEGDVTGVDRINFLGNEEFSDKKLRGVIATKESTIWNLFSSNDNYDPDRLTYDKELLRQYYLTQGYADFQVTSAVAELTPDREDFFITFTVEEGKQYDFGEVAVKTELDKLNEKVLKHIIPIREGERYNAELIEKSIDSLTFAAGSAGYAFVDVKPRIRRERDERKINITFEVNEGPRVYVEKIRILGNTRTLDRVIRREMRLAEGDAFNKVLLNRSRARIRGLGFFKEVEIKEEPGSAPDRTVVNVEVEEQPTGELSLGAGFSSTESIIGEFSVSERNLMGRGQFLRLRLSVSGRRQLGELRFREPYLFGRNLSGGFDLFANRINFEEANFRQMSFGGGVSAGFPLSEYTRLTLRYTLRNDDTQGTSSCNRALVGLTVDADGDGELDDIIDLDNDGLPDDINQDGVVDSQDLLPAVSEVICADQGGRLASIGGYVFRHDRRNDPIEPTRGFDITFQQDVAGLGGEANYLRSELDFGVYRGLWSGVIASFTGNAGYIFPLDDDGTRINDRFFKGGPSFRGFNNLGIGPRDQRTNEALGGRLYAIGTAEVSFPLGLPEEFGLLGGIFTEFGTLGLLEDNDIPTSTVLQDPDLGLIGHRTLDLRLTVGASVYWESPFGPVRFDLGFPLIKEDFDDTETFQFRAGTRF
ncbi:MAG: outer membrane protein assembly factor BamA [Alphaproteobacteria bacterium]